ncbi:hypothetical protein TEHN7118_0899 [Tetragenococcus halophilus subsp. halophilus]|uniref:Uncharacterized protein n=1 Tax=Tetragenococcus halophilus subsp. halophilus TaxID=1513897 RepID=A0A2H6CSX2_TETHA|nr:hypothetical protein TEHN7118_0899 [Tetragenococcus halophilus subsp. halophilus]
MIKKLRNVYKQHPYWSIVGYITVFSIVVIILEYVFNDHNFEPGGIWGSLISIIILCLMEKQRRKK